MSSSVLDNLVRTYIAPALIGAGFTRKGRAFRLDHQEAVAAIEVQRGKSGRRFTMRGAIAYKAWAKALGASRSLDSPLDFPDWRITAEDDTSPYGAHVEKWWALPNDDAIEMCGTSVREALCSHRVPAVLARLDPASDRDALLDLHGQQGIATDTTLARLYFWLKRLGPAHLAAPVRDQLLALGAVALVERVDLC